MSNELPESNDTDLVQDELTVLKQRADMIGVSYHPSIGLDKLKEKLANALLEEPLEAVGDDLEETQVSTETEGQKRSRLKKEASKLIRVRVTCMNPNKKEWEGEIFTVSNSVVGTFKKYVLFNSDDGYHVPQIIYNTLRDRKCQIFQKTRGPRGEQITKPRLISEFSIEILPPLTEKELKELARKQAMSNSID